MFGAVMQTEFDPIAWACFALAALALVLALAMPISAEARLVNVDQELAGVSQTRTP